MTFDWGWVDWTKGADDGRPAEEQARDLILGHYPEGTKIVYLEPSVVPMGYIYKVKVPKPRS